MQSKNRKIKRLLKKFDQITRNKKRLYSDRPGWKQNQSIRKKAQTLHAALKKLSEDAKAIFTRFDQTARQAKLGTFDRTKLVTQATNQLSDLKKQLNKAGPAIKSAEAQLNGAVVLKVQAKVTCQTALSQMAQSQRAIRDLIESLEDDVQSIQKMMPNQSEIPVCPGLLAHQLLPKIQADAKAISKHIQTINAAGASCRRATR
jgi:DNA repair exonuclease SbcCD ATPase subunit